MNLEKYEAIAPSKLLKEFDLYRVPVDLEFLCKKLGVVKTSRMRFSSHSGEISVKSDGKVKIWINPADHPNRQRFTLAHELGHLIYDIIPYLRTEEGASDFIDDNDSLRRDGRQHPEEYRANDFAAKLLMPKKLLIEHSNEIIESIRSDLGVKKVPVDLFVSKMASKFNVSEQAMRIRLENVGAI